jgi:nucleotide-binding universal stress UspA family protein
MDRLITPLDGSPLAELALSHSVRFAKRFGATLELVQVLDPAASSGRPTLVAVDEAERYLNDVASRYCDSVRIELHVLHGSPVDELLKFFRRPGNSMVVMSRHGHGARSRARFGGVAKRLLRQTTLPILVVDESQASTSGEINDILVPLDGSKLASSVLPYAIAIAGQEGRVCLVRVVQPPDERTMCGTGLPQYETDSGSLHHDASEAIDEARAFLMETATRLRKVGVNATWEIRFGDPSSEIVRAVETAGAQLVVMATHGWGHARQRTFGSVTKAVMEHGSPPVLVIPPTHDS